VHVINERLAVQRSPRHPDGQYFAKEYDGKVYCATVPGGLLHVRRGRSVGFWCGNSEAIGIDTHGTMKGSDGKIYTRMINAKTGKTELVPADKAAHSTIAFPGEMERGGKRVRAMVKAHQVEFVGPQDVDYVLPHHSQMFTSGSNLVPLISGSKAGRLLMGAKFINQALALEHPEEPLVQNLSQSGKSFDEIYGENVGAIRAKQPGVVTGVSNEHISVKYADGTTQDHELYHNFPFNRKSLLHNTPTVKIGDPVKPGTLLAKSNYTNDKGTMAVGHNLRVAYMPYRGLNYEDASVISESAAKAMASEHMYQNTLSDPEGTMDIGRKQFLSLFPGKFKPNQIENIGEDGTIKPGTKVKKGDPLVLALNRTQIDAVHRGRKPMFTDSTVTWDHESDGVVTDVEPMKEGGFNVVVKAYSPVQEGDKLCFDPATSVLTKSGWKSVAELTFKDEVATLSASGELE
jgi:DNA-directed RNA polymerase beta subunit